MKNFNNISSNEEQNSQATGWENVADYANKEKSLEQIRKENLESLKERGANEKIFESGVLEQNELFQEYLNLGADDFARKVSVKNGTINFGSIEHEKKENLDSRINGDPADRYDFETKIEIGYEIGVDQNGLGYQEKQRHGASLVSNYNVKKMLESRESHRVDSYTTEKTWFNSRGEKDIIERSSEEFSNIWYGKDYPLFDFTRDQLMLMDRQPIRGDDIRIVRDGTDGRVGHVSIGYDSQTTGRREVAHMTTWFNSSHTRGVEDMLINAVIFEYGKQEKEKLLSENR